MEQNERKVGHARVATGGDGNGPYAHRDAPSKGFEIMVGTVVIPAPWSGFAGAGLT